MKLLKAIPILVFLVLLSCKKEKNSTASKQLEALISAYQDYEGYNKTDYTLGFFTKEYYKAEAEFDIREFHEIILEQGKVTLPILEKSVNNYI